MIELRKEPYTARYLDPRKNFELAEVHAEVRYDPLTGSRGRVYELNWTTRPVDFSGMVGANRARCSFCPGNFEQRVARFAPDFCPEGVFRRGSAMLIPNILPYAEHAAVCVLTTDHIVPMGTMAAGTIADGFALILEYARKVSAHYRPHPFALLHWNYMPTSGGSMIHPHMQVYVTDAPLNSHRLTLADATAFRDRTGREFFGAYLEQELSWGERIVTKRGRCHLLAPFASRGMLGEFMIIIDGSYSYDEITADDIRDLAALTGLLSGYLQSRHIPGFNLALFSSPVGGKTMLNHLRIYPRVFRDTEVFATDIETPTILYGESFSLIPPEKNARELRQYLTEQGLLS